MTRRCICSALAISLACCGGAARVQGSTTGYVYAYFQGGWPTGGHSGVYMSYSEDGLNFTPMNDGNPVFVPPDAWGNDTDTDDEDQARDPSVVYANGVYHMVWTSGITTRSIGYASSTDLMNWTDVQLIDIWDQSTVVNHTWAPEVFYDEANSQFQIIFASDLDNGDHKLYSITTTDFTSFSSPSLYYYNGVTVIDAMIAYDELNNQYLMAIKDEQGGQKNVRLATASSAQGPWTTNNPIIVGPGSGIEENATEGPSIIKIGDTWYMYYDAYGAGYLGVATTTDSDPTNAGSWVNVTSQSTMPSGHHGTVFASPVSSIAFEYLPYSRSDLNGDEQISIDDWLIFTANHLVDLSGLTVQQQAALGDLNGDGLNDYNDFRLFKSDFDAIYGDGAFVTMLSSVPEPGTGLALGAMTIGLAAARKRRCS